MVQPFFVSRCILKFVDKLKIAGWSIKEIQIHPLVFEQLHKEVYSLTIKDLERFLSVKVALNEKVGITAKVASFPFGNTVPILEEPPTSTDQLVQALLQRDDVKRLFESNP